MLPHPIYQHLSQLRKQLGGVVTPQGLHIGKYPKDPAKIIEINRRVIESVSVYGNDRMYWLADGYFEQLERIPELRSFIQTRLPRPDLFQSVIAELQQWGYLKARNLEPKLVQADGLPDLEFGENEADGPFYFEVKTVDINSSPNAIRRHIKKANKQIKNVGGNAPGGCYIWFLPVSVGGYKNDGIPAELVPYGLEIERVLKSNSCKSVSKVVLTWNEVLVKGNIPGWQTWVVVRNSRIWEHENPRRKFTISL